MQRFVCLTLLLVTTMDDLANATHTCANKTGCFMLYNYKYCSPALFPALVPKEKLFNLTDWFDGLKIANDFNYTLYGDQCTYLITSYGEEILQRSPNCAARNGYTPIDGSCDSYIECIEFESRHRQCPDGLHYDPNVSWPDYPCGYPSDVACQGRSLPQPAMANAECPHKYGFFPSPKATLSECGFYRRCVEGKAMEMQCPAGLAFNPETARCDWPDLVASCNADDFLGFKCPPAPLDENNKPIETVINYKYDGNCFAFYSCIHDNARLLTCDPGFGFDPESGSCRPADKINCENPRRPA